MIRICKWGRLKAYLQLREVKSTTITWSAYASRIKADKTSICSHIKQPDSGFELQNSTFCKVLVMKIIEALRALFFSEVRIFIIPDGLKWIKSIGMTTTGLLRTLINTKQICWWFSPFPSVTLYHQMYSIIHYTKKFWFLHHFLIGFVLNLLWLHIFKNQGRKSDK